MFSSTCGFVQSGSVQLVYRLTLFATIAYFYSLTDSMTILYYSLILLAFVLLLLAIRLLTTLLHEIGHAIPAILLTRKRVSIYIGSYGDPNDSLHLRLGLLDMWLKYNPLNWWYRLCVPSATVVSVNRQIIYTMTGPLASITIASIACYYTFAFDVDRLKFVMVIFVFSAIYDLLTNLIPRSESIRLSDGTVTYNDGYQLKQLLYYKRLPKEYHQAIELYQQQRYAEAAGMLDHILRHQLKDEHIYQLTLSACLLAKNYPRAKELADDFSRFGTMTSDDLTNAGLAYSWTDDHHQALAFYDRVLVLNPLHKTSLNNKGYTLNVLGRFEEAVGLFDKAIEIDPLYAYSYNNRGLAKIKLGMTQDGLQDIQHSLQLDANNAYAYRNLGIYYLDLGQYAKAHELFVKAKELDPDTHMIDELLTQATELRSVNYL